MPTLDPYLFVRIPFTRCRKQAKKFVESVPQTLKENVPKEDAEKLQKTLQDLGATVSLV